MSRAEAKQERAQQVRKIPGPKAKAVAKGRDAGCSRKENALMEQTADSVMQQQRNKEQLIRRRLCHLLNTVL